MFTQSYGKYVNPLQSSPCTVLCLSIFLVWSPVAAFADFYKYLDETGGLNVTNDYNSIPERYRAGITIVKESDLQKKAQAREKQVRDERVRANKSLPKSEPAAQTQTLPESSSGAAVPMNEKAGSVSENSSSNKSTGWFARQAPLLKIAALIALFIGFAAVAGKLVSTLVPRTLGVIIRIALFVGVIVYVFKAYSENVVKAFAVMKSETDAIQNSAVKRIERIEKQAADR